jgi:hypothetical protein
MQMADEEAKAKAMGGYQCFHCKFPVEFTGSNKKCLCYVCGTVNIKPPGDPTGGWLPCVEPEGFEWEMPAGVMGPDVPQMKIEGKLFVNYDALVALPMNANVIFVDAKNKQWSRMDWVTAKKNDPAVTIKRMRERMKPRPIIELG